MIKSFLLLPLLLAAVLLSSCSLFNQGAGSASVQQLSSPQAVQTGLTVGGSFLVPKVSAQSKGAIHEFAVVLLGLSSANLDAKTVATLVAQVHSIPSSDQAIAGVLIDGGVAAINLAIAKFGEHNPQVVAYAQAVGNGLIAAGF